MANVKKKMVKAVDLAENFYSTLIDPIEASSYLKEALEEKGSHRQAHILKALREIAKAHGILKLSKGSESRRRTLYKALSENGNPSLETLLSLLEDLGLTLDIKPLKKAG